ncbi:MAG: diadenylate cyclase CdaA [Spirochaetales bacterium]|nr:diadenylate cyclase CdaA [Spirochaetales bacterium]
MDWLSKSLVFREIIRPLLDVSILAFIIYRSYEILVRTRAVQLIKGAILMALVYLLAFFLKLNTLLWILNLLVPGLVIGIAIIFQPELRKIFTQIGQGEWLKLSGRTARVNIESIVNSVEVMAERRWGCLIVLSRNVGLKSIIESGTMLNADLSSSLLLTIFSENAALHDGAVIIREGKIIAAGCLLPLSEQSDIRRAFGTRHRAALGLAEETDAVIIVVSEETGAISLAFDANLLYDLSADEITRRLHILLGYREEEEELEIEE